MEDLPVQSITLAHRLSQCPVSIHWHTAILADSYPALHWGVTNSPGLYSLRARGLVWGACGGDPHFLELTALNIK